MSKPKSYVDQTREALLSGIASKSWKNTLPPVRTLCRTLLVSYPTLHAALSQLHAEQIIELRHGRPTRILKPARSGTQNPASHKITLLSPSISTRSADFQLLYTRLNEYLTESGFILKWRVVERIGSKVSDAFLTRLIESDDADGFVLAHSSQSTQQFFQKAGCRTVVIGSLHSGVSLPNLEPCHKAGALHAAGKLRAGGHTHALVLIPADAGKGDMEALETFSTQFRQNKQNRITVLEHEWIPEQIESRILAHLNTASAASAFFIMDPYAAVTALTTLLNAGLRIPRDCSLLAARHDTLFDWTRPPLSHYTIDHVSAGELCARMIDALFKKPNVRVPSKLLIPDYVEKGSVGPAHK